MRVTLQNDLSKSEELIEKAARVCYASDSKGSRAKFIHGLIKSGHESVLEHASATFLVENISRACSHQLVRHRIASYSQRSQRYVDENKFRYVIPESILSDEAAYKDFKLLMFYCNSTYAKLRALGVPKEDARFVLPNACCTTIMVTMNFRELRHFFKLRTSPKAQWEIRQLAMDMLDTCMIHAPHVFQDIWEEVVVCQEEMEQDPKATDRQQAVA